jgi:hypothetical protein
MQQGFLHRRVGTPGEVLGDPLNANLIQAGNRRDQFPGRESRIIEYYFEDLVIRIPQCGDELLRLGGLIGQENAFFQRGPAGFGRTGRKTSSLGGALALKPILENFHHPQKIWRLALGPERDELVLAFVKLGEQARHPA